MRSRPPDRRSTWAVGSPRSPASRAEASRPWMARPAQHSPGTRAARRNRSTSPPTARLPWAVSSGRWSWRRSRDSRASVPSSGAVVAERVVAFAHGLPEADLFRARHEVEPLLRVARDAVEQHAQAAALLQARLRGLVAERLQHDQLVERQPRHAAGKLARAIL